MSILNFACSSTAKTKRGIETSVAATNEKLLNQLGIPAYAPANTALLQSIAGWMGTPYRYGGNDKNGTDCSGFINAVYAEVYRVQLPRTTTEMEKLAQQVKERNLAEGDLVFFAIASKKTGHAGIYLHEGYFAHASTSKGVVISRLSQDYWKQYFVGGGVVLPKSQRQVRNP